MERTCGEFSRNADPGAFEHLMRYAVPLQEVANAKSGVTCPYDSGVQNSAHVSRSVVSAILASSLHFGNVATCMNR
jgi:hypothetical protein